MRDEYFEIPKIHGYRYVYQTSFWPCGRRRTFVRRNFVRQRVFFLRGESLMKFFMESFFRDVLWRVLRQFNMKWLYKSFRPLLNRCLEFLLSLV